MPTLSDLTVRLGVDITEFQQRMREFRRNFRELGTQLQEQGTQIGAAFLGVGATIGAGLGVAVKAAADFEQGMSNIRAVSGATSEEMAELSKLAQEMGAQTKYSATEAALGIEELIKAGVSVTDIMDGGLKGALSLATAGNLELADAAEIASTALNAFKADNLSVIDAANILAGAANASATSVGELKFGLASVSAVASSVGMSFEDTTAALAVFAQNGLKGSDAGTSLKTMLMTLQPSTKEQIKLFKQLGLTTKQGTSAFFDQRGKLRSLEEIAGILNHSMRDMTDAQRLQAMQTIFGSDAIRASNILFKEGAQGVTAMKAAMSKVTAEEVAAEKMNNLNGAVEQLKGSFETLMISLGEHLLPYLTKLAKGVQVVVDWFNELSPTTKKIIVLGLSLTAVVTTLVGVLALFTAGLGILATAQWAVILPMLGMIAAAIAVVAAIAAIGAALVYSYKHHEGFRQIVDTTAKAVKDTFVKLGEALKPVIDAINTYITQKFSELRVWFLAIMPDMSKAFKNVFGAISVIFKEFVAFFEPVAKVFLDGLVKTFKDGWELIKFTINAVLSVITNTIELFINVFTGDWKAAWENIKNITKGVLDAVQLTLVNVINTLINLAKTGLTTFAAVFKSIFNGLYPAIKPAINLIIKGVNTMINSINGVQFDVPDWVPKIGGKKLGFDIPNVPQLAQGGIVTKPTLAMIGEGRESEAVIPLSKLKDMIGQGNGSNITIETMNVRSDNDINLIARELYNLSQARSRGGGRR